MSRRVTSDGGLFGAKNDMKRLNAEIANNKRRPNFHWHSPAPEHPLTDIYGDDILPS